MLGANSLPASRLVGLGCPIRVSTFACRGWGSVWHAQLTNTSFDASAIITSLMLQGDTGENVCRSRCRGTDIDLCRSRGRISSRLGVTGPLWERNTVIDPTLCFRIAWDSSSQMNVSRGPNLAYFGCFSELCEDLALNVFSKSECSMILLLLLYCPWFGRNIDSCSKEDVWVIIFDERGGGVGGSGAKVGAQAVGQLLTKGKGSRSKSLADYTVEVRVSTAIQLTSA